MKSLETSRKLNFSWKNIDPFPWHNYNGQKDHCDCRVTYRVLSVEGRPVVCPEGRGRCLVVVTERQMEAGEAERSHTGPGGAADWPLLVVAYTRAA